MTYGCGGAMGAGTVSATYLYRAFRAAIELGARKPVLLEETGIEERDLRNPLSRLSGLLMVRLIDAEPRAVTLEERILEEDAHLAQWARLLADEHWASADSLLLMNSASHAALDRLVLAAARPAHDRARPARRR